MNCKLLHKYIFSENLPIFLQILSPLDQILGQSLNSALQISYYTPWGPPPSPPPPKSDKTLYTGIYLPTFREGTNFIIKLLVSCLGALTGPRESPSLLHTPLKSDKKILYWYLCANLSGGYLLVLHLGALTGPGEFFFRILRGGPQGVY